MPQNRHIERRGINTDQGRSEPDPVSVGRQIAGGAALRVQQRCHRRILTQPVAKRAGEPRQDQTPDRASRHEGEPENEKRERLGRRARVDELGKKRQEEELTRLKEKKRLEEEHLAKLKDEKRIEKEKAEK